MNSVNPTTQNSSPPDVLRQAALDLPDKIPDSFRELIQALNMIDEMKARFDKHYENVDE